MPTVGQSEFRTHLYAIARDVRDNRATYTITKRGKPVAMLVPCPVAPEADLRGRENAWAEFADLLSQVGQSSTAAESTEDLMRWARGRLD